MSSGTAWPDTIPACIGRPPAGESRVTAGSCFGTNSGSILAGLDEDESRNEAAQHVSTIPPVEVSDRTGIQTDTIRLNPNIEIRTERGGTETTKNVWRVWLGLPGGKVARFDGHGSGCACTGLPHSGSGDRHAKRNRAPTPMSHVQVLRSRTVDRDCRRRSCQKSGPGNVGRLPGFVRPRLRVASRLVPSRSRSLANIVDAAFLQQGGEPVRIHFRYR